MTEGEQEFLRRILPPAPADEQRPSTIIGNVLFKVFKVLSELKGRYVYGHGNLFPQSRSAISTAAPARMHASSGLIICSAI